MPILDMPVGLGELFLRVVSTPTMDEALRQVADRPVWQVPRPTEPGPAVKEAARAKALRTLAR